MNPPRTLLWGLVNAAMAATVAAAVWAVVRPPEPIPVLLTIGEWTLTDRTGRPFGSGDLAGRVWIADFIFTNCAGPCPVMTRGMERLQKRLEGERDIRFVSFSVDPVRDTPAAIDAWIARSGWEVDPDRWSFVTGREVYNLVYDRFKLEARPDPKAPPGFEIIHDTRFALVDRLGRMRGLYSYIRKDRETDEAQLDRLVRDARRLARESEELWSVRSLPRLNAALNGAGAALLCLGFYFITRKRVTSHKTCMLAALILSAAFLASYLTYHFNVGLIRYHGEGWWRPAYYAVLGSHTLLAGMVAPMALATVWLALRERFDRHRKLARWTLPLWLYVNITGILVYIMLYVLP